MKLLFVYILSIFLVSCEKPADYVYHYDPEPARDNSESGDGNIYRLKHLGLDAKVDVLFVVDNSGSMYTIQNNIVKNADLFMNEFIMQRHINWKLGVVSTDSDEPPYLGFDSLYGSDIFDYNDPTSIRDGVQIFADAIDSLGTSGSASEYIFYNTLRHFKDYVGQTATKPAFIRDTSHLAVIMVTDEKEQSQSRYGSAYEPNTFLNTIGGFVNKYRNVRFYGALNRKDLEGCDNPGDYSTYTGSAYETIIDNSGGFNISACLDDFGTRLADIGKDIASMVKSPGIPLRGNPKVYTIRIFYKDLELCPGAEADGGNWYYEEGTNKIVMYNYNFVEDFNNDFLTIDFELDDGIPRDVDEDTRTTCGE